jgi:hypothetical protein
MCVCMCVDVGQAFPGPCNDEVNDRWWRAGRRSQELEMYTKRGDTGGFLPAMKQLANVAGLPGALVPLHPPHDTRASFARPSAV